ncbi:MAG: RcnB family protein [Hyphomonadaceae bacterium]|nr:RcnB family protein [Hyphomonadaceae bacterium]MBX3511006.1 RcnB family protein [Hyphomonadaceae bacterium]
MLKQASIAAAAALTLAGPLAGVANAQPRPHGPPPHAQAQSNRWDDREHNGYYYQGRWYDGRPSAQVARDRSYRPGYQAVRWDPRAHNGYRYQGRWYYGQPSPAIQRDRSFQPGYQAWRRGDRLSAYQRQAYRPVDYRRERLQAPPRGYHYVRSDRGETLLVGIATGVILSVMLSGR